MKTCDVQVDEASVLLIDNDGIIVDARESACAALGWAREELINKKLSEALEFGADDLKDRLNELESSGEEGASISFLTLVRRQDQSSLPTTALLKRVPELGCFTVAFDDLPGNVREVSRLTKTDNPPVFRNIFLTGARPVPPEPVEAEPVQDGGKIAALLEAESQERQRLEARVLSLTEQLQQLHAQLGKNLESENLCQKKLGEREMALRNEEQARVAAEISLDEERKQRAHAEGNLATIKSAQAQLQEDQKARQRDWQTKLEESLNALRESDARLAEEMAKRQGIANSLQELQGLLGAGA